VTAEIASARGDFSERSAFSMAMASIAVSSAQPNRSVLIRTSRLTFCQLSAVAVRICMTAEILVTIPPQL
jgi:hypothetical protein